MNKWRSIIGRWKGLFDSAELTAERVNPGWPNSIAVDDSTYQEIRAKVHPVRIKYDTETKREYIVPPPIFKRPTE